MGQIFQAIRDFFSGLKTKWSGWPKTARIVSIVIVCCIVAGLIAFEGWYWFSPTVIEGMDASHYQGNISWKAVTQSSNHIEFVYLKATEGRTYVDSTFKTNWNGARNVGLKVGAYHFFSSSSSGEDQAKNFIAAVPKVKGALPPAIDIEATITQENDFKKQVTAFVKLVQAHYGQKPVFYVPPRIYNILYSEYSDYPFWVINTKSKPDVVDWTFWQYTYNGSIAGINGKVDLDRYQGTRMNLIRLLS